MSSFDDDEDFLSGDESDQALAALASRVSPISRSVVSSVDAMIDTLDVGFTDQLFTEEQIDRIVNTIPAEFLAVDDVGADFDLLKEVALQVKMVNALRNRIMTGGGLKKDVSIAEAKSVLDSCRQTNEVVRKNMESLVNLNRIQALEAAVIQTVRSELNEVQIAEFLVSLEKNLAIFCKND